MKNILLVFGMVACTSVFAQQQKGDLSIQFSGIYLSQKTKYDNYTDKSGYGTINVKMGKFFTDNLELGVKPFVTFSLFTEAPVTSGADKKAAKTEFKAQPGFGLYGAYSFLMPDGKFLLYGGAEINYVPVGEEATINLGPYGGAKYFITERVNLDANMSWLINLGSTYTLPKNDYDIRPMFNFNVGVGVLLGKLTD